MQSETHAGTLYPYGARVSSAESADATPAAGAEDVAAAEVVEAVSFVWRGLMSRTGMLNAGRVGETQKVEKRARWLNARKQELGKKVTEP